MVKVECDWCGKSIERKPSKIGIFKHCFCNQKCFGEWQSVHKTGGNHPSWSRQKVKCDTCGKSFDEKPSKIKRFAHHFCSRECFGKWESINKRGTNNPNFGVKHTKEALQKIREARRRQKPQTHHTKPELAFEKICKNNNLPFKYVGESDFWIGNKPSINPDFIHITKKIAIEIFGAYWHSPLLNPYLSRDRTLKDRERALKKHGWECVVIWDTDLLRKDAEAFVLKKLKKEKVI